MLVKYLKQYYINLDISDRKYCLMTSLSLWHHSPYDTTLLMTSLSLWPHSPYDITLLMTSLLVFFLLVSKVATLTQVKVIYSQPFFHICVSVSQPARNFGFIRLQCLNVITSNNWTVRYISTCIYNNNNSNNNNNNNNDNDNDNDNDNNNSNSNGNSIVIVIVIVILLIIIITIIITTTTTTTTKQQQQ